MPLYYRNVSGLKYVSKNSFIKEVIYFRVATKQVEQETVPSI